MDDGLDAGLKGIRHTDILSAMPELLQAFSRCLFSFCDHLLH